MIKAMVGGGREGGGRGRGFGRPRDAHAVKTVLRC